MPGKAACDKVSPIKLLRLNRTILPTSEEEIAMLKVPNMEVLTTGLVKKSIT